MIDILKAPPYATVQDFGFPRGRAWGLPRCGAMDPIALRSVNAGAQNPPGTAALEWGLGPLVVRFDRETQLAAIPFVEISAGAGPVRGSVVVTAPAGAPITLVPNPQYRFSYLAVRGGFDLPEIFSSRSTYLAGSLGGLDGRMLRAGDRLRIGTAPTIAGKLDSELLTEAAFELEDLVLGATPGPQWDRFDPPARERFFGSRFTVDRASDRSGYRLSGPAVLPREKAGLPSEAACPGAVQIPDNGQPIVLMPDGPTVGGYPKLAVVGHRDLARLAQCQPGRTVRFRETSIEAARAGLRLEAGQG